MPRNQVAGFWHKLFGRRGTLPTPAETWLRQRREASPEEVLRQHFAAMEAHDADWLMATMTPERARLYGDARTLDKRRLTVSRARLLAVAESREAFTLPAMVAKYRSFQLFEVEFELDLVEPEQRRDPTLLEGRQRSYFILVQEGPGHPWLIADWGK
ncbi:MAG TPA: DUF4829 domain-containing protein [Symbiobacteriaceae bacterium]|nr:DUF4829 domain-containing protein [Symbiobacteriaceae bacterium]